MQTKLKLTHILFFFALLSILMLPSCVAKKKFIEMESYRTKAEQRVKELTSEVTALRIEFNDYQNDFRVSNVGKNSFIDSLNQIVVGLNSDLLSSNENIEDQIFSFQVEKRRLNQLLAEKDREIRRVQRSADMLKIQTDDVRNEMQDLNIELRNAESSTNSIERMLDQKDREISRLKNDIVKKENELTNLRSDVKSTEEQVESLQNQVKLLKSQFGQK
ncbi:MAG: hypothetical protein PF541_11655 [Prolixibacteraceae bacterium]|jgi:chromosome segregation ATPase|nr:hypothetical protein [Prolixibacteraceae bacterium]